MKIYLLLSALLSLPAHAWDNSSESAAACGNRCKITSWDSHPYRFVVRNQDNSIIVGAFGFTEAQQLLTKLKASGACD